MNEKTIYRILGWVGITIMALANFKFMIGLALWGLWHSQGDK